MVKFVAFNVLLFGCWFYSLARGGAPERVASTVFVVGSIVTALVANEAAARFRSIEIGILAVDVAALAAFLAVALFAERLWPLWLTALQLIGTAAHLVRVTDPAMIPWAYAFALAFWSYPMLIILAIGTWNHQKRLARFGADRSWSSFSGRSAGGPRSGRPG
ncbi:MAG TPA: hypothetical protein VHM92_05055 [Allosphingosinicella sp.]|nr:hypothetical protein [Allosphingosinicella sp.]